MNLNLYQPTPATHPTQTAITPPANDRDLFHFHPRTTNPELWRTSIPLVVRERCGRHKGLITTWLAIHWLIVINAANGRTHFGVREIAEEANVGRNELTGPTGYIQQLVQLGLIRIVGYKSFKGLHKPRPVYHVNLAELERLSLELVPDVLRNHHIDRPPPATPDPHQLRLFSPHPDDLPRPMGADEVALTQASTTHQSVTDTASTPMVHQSGLAQTAAAHSFERVMHKNRTVTEPGSATSPVISHITGTESSVLVPAPPDSVQCLPENGTVLARNGDMDRSNERKIEGVSYTPSPDFLHSLVTQATQAVLATLQAQNRQIMPENAPPALTVIPPAPDGAEPLPASVLALWQGDSPDLSRRDMHQLAMIAAEHDRSTSGHGAYWLGRAILMADLCLGERGQPRSLSYIRRMIQRWRDEDSWGSDRETAGAPRSHATPAPTPVSVRQPPAKVTEQATDDNFAHPAVRAYITTLHETPNAVQAAQIAATVTDLPGWNQVLHIWQLNGWGERSVGKMLDRYKKAQPGAAAATEGPVSAMPIYMHPTITHEERDQWMRRFRAASSPAEQRAVLERLADEHPLKKKSS